MKSLRRLPQEDCARGTRGSGLEQTVVPSKGEGTYKESKGRAGEESIQGAGPGRYSI